MHNSTSATAIQITLDLWPLLAGLVLLPLTIAAAIAALRKGPPTLLRPLLTRALLTRALLSRKLLERFGLAALPRGVATAFGLLWLVLFLALVLGVLWTIAAAVIRLPALWQVDPGDLRWFLLTLTALTASLAAVIALPFTLLRTGVAARQTRTAEENLTTDLINKAVQGLGAQKEVNRIGRPYEITDHSFGEDCVRDNGIHWIKNKQPVEDRPEESSLSTNYSNWQVFASTEPNIEVRLGAIYALERIAQDSDRDHIRVMEILCAYLRENAPARDARRHDLGPWPDYPENPTAEDLPARATALEDRRKALDRWIKDLRENHAPRADIQAAITVIGRRSPTQIALEETQGDHEIRVYRLDLRKVNLQGADLISLNLANAQLEGANLAGAFLRKARLEGAWLTRANIDGADLRAAHLEDASLESAYLEGADLATAHLEATNLMGACLQRAQFNRSHLQGTHLMHANMEKADFSADLWLLFGGTKLERANLYMANLIGAQLRGLHLSETTSLRPATLQGAGLQAINVECAITDDQELPYLLSEAFGDASVILPDGLRAGEPPLEHWSSETLNWDDFEAAWRAHQRAIGYTPPD